jgi:hypothetical protein
VGDLDIINASAEIVGSIITLTPLSDGIVSIRIRPDTGADLRSNPGVGSELLSWNVDTTGPSLIAVTPLSSSLTQEVEQFQLRFSESVSGLSFENIALTSTGLRGPVELVSLEGGGSLYTLTVRTGSGRVPGRLAIGLTNTETLFDSLNNVVLPSGSFEFAVARRALAPIIAGATAGSEPRVTITDAITNRVIGTFLAYESSFQGGVQAILADLDGDGEPEVITAPGVGGSALIKVFTLDGNLIRQFFVFEESFRGGATLAAGDVTGTGQAMVVVGAGVGGGPRVVVLRPDGSTVSDFFAGDPESRNGVSVVAGRATGGGPVEILATPNTTGGSPELRVYSAFGVLLRTYATFENAFQGGGTLTGGDFSNSGRFDLVIGAGPGGGPRVLVLNGRTGRVISSFFAGDPNERGGVTLSVVDILGNRSLQLATQTASGVRLFDPLTGAELTNAPGVNFALVRAAFGV